MKHIKLFESFKKEDYYTQVTKVDWNNSIGIEMDKSIYNQIEEFYLHNIKGDGTKLQEDHYINNDEPQIEFLGIKIYLSKIGGGDRRVVSIIQSEDEWFWTWVFNTYENKSEYYKCDQLEGLFNLLNNINDEISINESKMEKDLYDIIPIGKRDSKLRGTRENFTKSEIESIRDLTKQKGLLFTIYPSVDGGYTNSGLNKRMEDNFDVWEEDLKNIKQHIQIIKNSGGVWQKNTNIYKLEDEWFIILINSSYPYSQSKSYLCDSIDGVMNCLDKELI